MEREYGIFLHPAVTINKYTYRGYLEGEDIFKAVSILDSLLELSNLTLGMQKGSH